jgi:hypothetical protein
MRRAVVLALASLVLLPSACAHNDPVGYTPDTPYGQEVPAASPAARPDAGSREWQIGVPEEIESDAAAPNAPDAPPDGGALLPARPAPSWI